MYDCLDCCNLREDKDIRKVLPGTFVIDNLLSCYIKDDDTFMRNLACSVSCRCLPNDGCSKYERKAE
jgi:hypothetical protein